MAIKIRCVLIFNICVFVTLHCPQMKVPLKSTVFLSEPLNSQAFIERDNRLDPQPRSRSQVCDQ